METTEIRYDAPTLNAHLASGGYVQVTTYTRSTIYGPKHAGCFEERNGDLRIRNARRGVEQISIGQRMLVGLRLGTKR